MTTRRDVLKLGVFGGAVAIAGVQQGAARAASGSGSGSSSGSGSGTASQLAAAKMPVPYKAVFRRPPELLPYATGLDPDGQPFAKYSVSQRLGKAEIAPGLSTTIAGYNGTFPGPTIQVPQEPGLNSVSATGCRPRACCTRRRSIPSPTCTAPLRSPNTTGMPTTAPPRGR